MKINYRCVEIDAITITEYEIKGILSYRTKLNISGSFYLFITRKPQQG